MKYLKSYEGLKFNYEDESEYRDAEFVVTDRRNLFLDFEEEYLYRVGFDFDEQKNYFYTNEGGFLIVVTKHYDRDKKYATYYFNVYIGDVPSYSSIIDSGFHSLENAETEDDRLYLLKDIVNQIYVIINFNKKREEMRSKREKIKLKRQGVEAPDITGVGSGKKDWWSNLEETEK